MLVRHALVRSEESLDTMDGDNQSPMDLANKYNLHQVYNLMHQKYYMGYLENKKDCKASRITSREYRIAYSSSSDDEDDDKSQLTMEYDYELDPTKNTTTKTPEDCGDLAALTQELLDLNINYTDVKTKLLEERAYNEILNKEADRLKIENANKIALLANVDDIETIKENCEKQIKNMGEELNVVIDEKINRAIVNFGHLNPKKDENIGDGNYDNTDENFVMLKAAQARELSNAEVSNVNEIKELNRKYDDKLERSESEHSASNKRVHNGLTEMRSQLNSPEEEEIASMTFKLGIEKESHETALISLKECHTKAMNKLTDKMSAMKEDYERRLIDLRNRCDSETNEAINILEVNATKHKKQLTDVVTDHDREIRELKKGHEAQIDKIYENVENILNIPNFKRFAIAWSLGEEKETSIKNEIDRAQRLGTMGDSLTSPSSSSS